MRIDILYQLHGNTLIIMIICLLYNVFHINFRLLIKSIISDTIDDEIWLDLNVFLSIIINVIGDILITAP